MESGVNARASTSALPLDRVLSRLLTLLVPSVQLALVVLLIFVYQIESRTFFNVALLAAAGFIVHGLLPLAYRLPFFVALSFAAVGVAFGIRDGAMLVVAGLALIGTCHLPLRLSFRVVLLLGVTALFAAWRSEVLPSPVPAIVWPILASMFMFRIAVYLYALEHDEQPASPARTLAYFFMLPNVCFPLFPVVDYRTFGRTYYDREEKEIYDQGVNWIVRGLMHLLLYRFIYQYLTVNPQDVAGLGDVVQLVLSTFGLYLRVSGQFHLIVGMLHLFGFRLPETHRLYYLASSFTDFWRRINIYWKDFMMKLVYYPSFFRLRRWGDRTALIGATVIVFLSTWILHSYQWFWLRGGFPVTLQDGLFWGILGAFVVVNSLRELRRGRKRLLKQESRWNLRLGLRTALMFWTMAVLWSLWSSESVGEWLGMWIAAAQVDAKGILLLVVVTAGFVYAGGRDWNTAASPQSTGGLSFLRQPVAVNVALLAGLLLAAQPAAQARMLPGMASALTTMQSSTLNARDAELQHKGYYEQLDNQSRMSAELWNLTAQQPADWVRFDQSDAYRARTDFLMNDFEPNVSTTFKGAPMTTNQWGMRDRDYALAKAIGTYRIGVVGPSISAGSGVSDREVFDAVLEEHLNAPASGFGSSRFEVLNFSIPGHSLIQHVALLDDRALAFNLDVVMIVLPPHHLLANEISNHLTDVISAGVPIPYPSLEQTLAEMGREELGREGPHLPTPQLRSAARSVGLESQAPEREIRRWLRAESEVLVGWAVEHLVGQIRAAGAVPVFLALDNIRDATGDASELRALADEHDVLLLNFYDLYEGRDPATLRVAEWDGHPNPLAHRLIAERLYEEISRHRAELGLESGTPLD